MPGRWFVTEDMLDFICWVRKREDVSISIGYRDLVAYKSSEGKLIWQVVFELDTGRVYSHKDWLDQNNPEEWRKVVT